MFQNLEFIPFVNSQIAYGGKLLDFFTGSSSSGSDKTEEPQAMETNTPNESSEEQIDVNVPEESKEVN